MKKLKRNKDVYDLTKLEVKVSHLIDGCGRRIDKQIYIDIKYDDKYIIKGQMVNEGGLKWLLAWLEEEYKEDK